MSKNVSSDIDKNANADFSVTDWYKIGAVKRLFGDYLITYGYLEAGQLYRLLASEYESCESMSVQEKRNMLTGSIRQHEIDARSKL